MSPGNPIGTVRSPGTVIALVIFTLGIYSIIWHYSVFEELRNWRGQGWSGLMYLLFTFILPIAFVAPWLLPAYVGRMYSEAGEQPPVTGWTGCWVFLPIAGPIVWLVKTQGALNVFWSARRPAAAAA